uniref:Uncharacterized protein n=1 Tax=Tanacetum cinerariifolium TaxID=118510 RepID=A0A6L2N509_TANCI|nr:hypothetical protein [Tanacetum cinerariifolium]
MVMLMLRYKKITFDARPRPNRQAIWYCCPMHGYKMEQTNERGVVAASRASGVMGQGFRRGNTTIDARGHDNRSITLHEVIQDCMSLQTSDSSDEESDPPVTHGLRS